ncbi:hypothetical protein EVAR_74942_1 [Eumeta japonica]|uniref:Uncharacterized protein n=1 Tax=Eumeta variegata TaxID=151549 RepID=A0A4C1UJ42_EUMVA|nr:hypothetical protein EVAR_74942_1 [Eumeta japonica]
MASSVRTRSASPKSVSFSPVLERKYSVDRPSPAEPADWRHYYPDFSSYLVQDRAVSYLKSKAKRKRR